MIKLARAMQYLINTELSLHEETRFEFNRSTGAIKLGIDVHQDFHVVVEGGRNQSQVAAAIPQASVAALGGQVEANWSRGARSL